MLTTIIGDPANTDCCTMKEVLYRRSISLSTLLTLKNDHTLPLLPPSVKPPPYGDVRAWITVQWNQAHMNPHSNRKSTFKIWRPDNIETKTVLGDYVTETPRIPTIPIALRTIFCSVLDPGPRCVQRLCGSETKVANRRLWIRHAKEIVLRILLAEHASVCAIKDSSQRWCSIDGWGSIELRKRSYRKQHGIASHHAWDMHYERRLRKRQWEKAELITASKS